MTERNIIRPFYRLPGRAWKADPWRGVRRHDPDFIVIVGTSLSFFRFT